MRRLRRWAGSGSSATAGSATPAGSAAAATPTKAAEPVKAPEPPAPPKPEAPVATGVLDLQLEHTPAAPGGTDTYRVLTPRIAMTFKIKPQVQRQDTQAPDGTTIPGAIAVAEAGNQFDGLIYIPIPEGVTYDVKKGLKGARDGVLKMFESQATPRDEATTLGPFKANHLIAEGARAGHEFHLEAWFAFDDTSRAVYGLLALREKGVVAGIAELHDGFVLREGVAAAPAAPATEAPLVPTKRDGATKAAPAKPAPAKPAPAKPAGDAL